MKSFKQFVTPHEYDDATSFAPKGSVGIPRSEMPQIAQKDVPAFLMHLTQKGIPVRKETLMPTDIHLTQLELNQDKINALKDVPDGVEHPIVSQHNQLLDGHHRIAAKQQFKPTLATKVWKVGLPIMDLIRHAKEFPKSFNKSVNESK